MTPQFDRKTRSAAAPALANLVERTNGSDAMTSHSPIIATEQDPRWAAVLARDPSADRLFVYGVKTTGIYCRPSSLARLPSPENVEFFDTAAQAEAAGYRPSKRAGQGSERGRRTTCPDGGRRLPPYRNRRTPARAERTRHRLRA